MGLRKVASSQHLARGVESNRNLHQET